MYQKPIYLKTLLILLVVIGIGVYVTKAHAGNGPRVQHGTASYYGGIFHGRGGFW